VINPQSVYARRNFSTESREQRKEQMDTKTTLKLTLQGARKVLDAALKEATARGQEISVAVVDSGGHLIALARTDEAELQTITIAENKARSSAFTGIPTGKKSKAGNEGSDHHLLAITLAAGTDNFVTVQGGLPLIVKGQCVGGVGVSGAAHADGDIANAGAEALSS
jgi:uncharacterized protein GlcG (DUF336 family)